MVRGLNPEAGMPRRRRRAQALVLVLAVLAMHAFVGSQIAEHMADFSVAASLPARIEVAYVRDMELAAPPAVAPVPIAAPARAARAPRARKPARPAASAPTLALIEEAPAGAPSERPDPPEPHAPVQAEASPEPPEPPAPPASTPEAVAVAPPASAPVAAPGRSFEWPGPTRLSYALSGNYRGEINGRAQVEWVRVGSRYQVHLDVLVGLPIAALITRRMSSEGDITAEGLAPQRYDEDTKLMFQARRRLTIRFEPDALVMANGQRQERPAGVQDSASQFVQLSYLFSVKPELLVVGAAVELPLALARKVHRWVYDVLAQEALSTPFGAVDTFHLKPRHVAQAGSDLSAEIWIAPSLHYLPARIRIRQDADTFIDMMIERKPQLAAPP
jgi:hypothetical protein